MPADIDICTELAGYSQTIDSCGRIAEDEFPFCTTSKHDISFLRIADFVGALPGRSTPREECRHAEWETQTPEKQVDTTFTWIGGSQLRPVRASVYPFVEAILCVDGEPRLGFPLNVPQFRIAEGDYVLEFSARRYQSLAEVGPHRKFNPDGMSGVFRLSAKGDTLTPGKALRLSVELGDPPDGITATYYTSPRVRTHVSDTSDLEQQVVQLQRDMIQLRQSYEQLQAQITPEVFPNRLPCEKVLVHVDTKHYHPANLSKLKNGHLLIAVREAADHLDVDGRLVLFRSEDGGSNWSGPRLLFDEGRSDHRSGCIFELPNGDWIAWDYRCGANYAVSGEYIGPTQTSGPTLWGAWSTDKGENWTFTEPLTVPGAFAFAEAERPIIRLPNGRLLLAGHCIMPKRDDTGSERMYRDIGEMTVVIFASDDDGRSWRCLAGLPRSPFVLAEPSIVDTGNRIILVARSERHFNGGPHWRFRGSLMQSISEDGGSTWSDWQPTGLSSMSSPAHLLKLADGRVLCTHAQRVHPYSILLTLSHDEGTSWDAGNTRILADDIANFDACYPVTVETSDGSMVTTWYANRFGRFYIVVARYRVDDL